VKNWPNFFIVGAPKTGTSSLYNHLKEIPGIYMSPVKEPNYFSRSNVPDNSIYRPIRDKEEYLNLFEKVKDEKIVGDASTKYLTDVHAYELIHQVSPQARILISLRDPVDRTFSQYLMNVQMGRWTQSFHERLQMELEHPVNKSERHLQIYEGMYSESVKRYLEVFGPQQVKIIIFEEWIRNTKDTIEEILRFLGLNNSVTNFKNTVQNQFIGLPGPVAQRIISNSLVAKIAKIMLPSSSRIFLRNKFLLKQQPKPKMRKEDREVLVKFFYNDVMKLQKILERKLPWPNFQTTQINF